MVSSSLYKYEKVKMLLIKRFILIRTEPLLQTKVERLLSFLFLMYPKVATDQLFGRLAWCGYLSD